VSSKSYLCSLSAESTNLFERLGGNQGGPSKRRAMRVASEIADARKAGTGPPGKELTGKQKETKRKKKKVLSVVSFFAFCV
jgi:hypothetical protein